MKIRPVGAELFYEDWQTDRRARISKLTIAFRDFANPPKNIWSSFQYRAASNVSCTQTQTSFKTVN